MVDLLVQSFPPVMPSGESFPPSDTVELKLDLDVSVTHPDQDPPTDHKMLPSMPKDPDLNKSDLDGDESELDDEELLPSPYALKNQIEAILYLKGEPLALATVAQLASCSKEDAYEALLELIEDYAHRDSALEVIAIKKQFVLQLKDPFRPMINEILPPEIGVGATRTLATIILRGPLSQVDLVDLRGASAYQHVAELVEKGFVTKFRKSGSRSAWLRVTDKFHRYFSVDELATSAADQSLRLVQPTSAEPTISAKPNEQPTP